MRKDPFKEFKSNMSKDLIGKIMSPYIKTKLVSDLFNLGKEYLYCSKCGILYEGSSALVRMLSEEYNVVSLCDVCHSSGLLLELDDNSIQRINKLAREEYRVVQGISRSKWRIGEEQLSEIIFDEKI